MERCSSLFICPVDDVYSDEVYRYTIIHESLPGLVLINLVALKTV